MLKYVYLAATFSWLLLLQACGQSNSGAYDVMLRGLYKNTVPQISAEALKQKLQENPDVVLLDTRSNSEYAVSHLKDARFINFEEFDISRLDTISKNTPIVLYCSVGARSEQIGEKLLKAGYTEVYNLYGGIFKWVNEGNPVYSTKGKTKKVHAYSRSWGIWLQKGEKVYGTE